MDRVAGNGASHIFTEDAPRGTGAYSQALRAGDFVFISGQGPLDPATMAVVGDSIGDQVRATLRNVEAIAKASGGSLRDVVKIGAFLASIDLYSEFNEAYEDVFHWQPRPARTTVAAGLRDILVEIDAILYLPSARQSP